MSATTPPAGRGRYFLYAGLATLLVVALVGVDAVVLTLRNPALASSPHFYMALGDSLSFGYQPDDNFTSGFVDDVYAQLHQANGSELANYACSGETTSTMITGGCIGRIAHNTFYTGPQLQAALDFLADHRGSVSPITLEIGSNDVLPDWQSASCSPKSTTTADLANMDLNLTQVILPRLVQALQTPSGFRAGDLHLLNYYNPFAKECPDSAPFVHVLNDHLAADAAQFRIPVVDVYTAFGGDAGMAGNVCGAQPYTWICNAQFHDVHPTTLGYQAIAHAVEQTLGTPGTNPLPGIAPFGALAPRLSARRPDAAWERVA
jgi:lysophospholipase L1-like esterase